MALLVFASPTVEMHSETRNHRCRCPREGKANPLYERVYTILSTDVKSLIKKFARPDLGSTGVGEEWQV